MLQGYMLCLLSVFSEAVIIGKGLNLPVGELFVDDELEEELGKLQ
jgi:hypothetical protein